MKKLFFLPAIIILALFQSTILHSIKIFGIRPDLLLISMVIAGISFDLKWALFFSIFAGVLKDALAANTVAINTLLFPLWSFFIVKLAKKITIDTNFIRGLIVFVVVIFNDIAMRLILFSLGKFNVSLGMFLGVTLLESLYTALVAPLIFNGIGKYITTKNRA